MAGIRAEINKLERDLSNAMEDSNRCIADRLRLHEEKQLLLQQLRDWLRSMSQLESQLRLLSSTSSTPTPGGMMSAAMSSSASSLGKYCYNKRELYTYFVTLIIFNIIYLYYLFLPLYFCRFPIIISCIIKRFLVYLTFDSRV